MRQMETVQRFSKRKNPLPSAGLTCAFLKICRGRTVVGRASLASYPTPSRYAIIAELSEMLVSERS